MNQRCGLAWLNSSKRVQFWQLFPDCPDCPDCPGWQELEEALHKYAENLPEAGDGWYTLHVARGISDAR